MAHSPPPTKKKEKKKLFNNNYLKWKKNSGVEDNFFLNFFENKTMSLIYAYCSK
jgi:hypothetical protein